jgi:hypothetical protein
MERLTSILKMFLKYSWTISFLFSKTSIFYSSLFQVFFGNDEEEMINLFDAMEFQWASWKKWGLSIAAFSISTSFFSEQRVKFLTKKKWRWRNSMMVLNDFDGVEKKVSGRKFDFEGHIWWFDSGVWWGLGSGGWEDGSLWLDLGFEEISWSVGIGCQRFTDSCGLLFFKIHSTMFLGHIIATLPSLQSFILQTSPFLLHVHKARSWFGWHLLTWQSSGRLNYPKTSIPWHFSILQTLSKLLSSTQTFKTLFNPLKSATKVPSLPNLPSDIVSTKVRLFEFRLTWLFKSFLS